VFTCLGFWFLACYAAIQIATQLQQRCIQGVRSNKEARKRLTESNGTPAMDLGHKSESFFFFVYYYAFMVQRATAAVPLITKRRTRSESHIFVPIVYVAEAARFPHGSASFAAVNSGRRTPQTLNREWWVVSGVQQAQRTWTEKRYNERCGH